MILHTVGIHADCENLTMFYFLVRWIAVGVSVFVLWCGSLQ